MIAVNRTGIDIHFLTSGNLTQQLPAAASHISTQYLVTILRRPHQVILAIPDTVATSFVVLHRLIDYYASLNPSPKGEGFTDPLSGTLKWKITLPSAVRYVAADRRDFTTRRAYAANQSHNEDGNISRIMCPGT